jgi:hypothetical protein
MRLRKAPKVVRCLTEHLRVLVVADPQLAGALAGGLVALVVRALVGVVALLGHELADAMLAAVGGAEVLVIAHLRLVHALAVLALALLARVSMLAVAVVLAAVLDGCGGALASLRVALVDCAPVIERPKQPSPPNVDLYLHVWIINEDNNPIALTPCRRRI